MVRKIDPSPAFDKITQACQYLYTVFMTPKRTHMASISATACSKAEVFRLCLKI